MFTMCNMYDKTFLYRALDGNRLDANCKWDEKTLTSTITIDLPGYSKEEISVECKNNRLTIIAENNARGLKTSEWDLGERANTQSIKAAHLNGVLTVTIGVKEDSKSKRIAIE